MKEEEEDELFEPVSKFIKREKIHGITKESIDAFANNSILIKSITKHTISTYFSNLESIHIALNTYCKLPKYKKEECFLYMMKLYYKSDDTFTGMIKIGMTCRDIERRKTELNNSWKGSEYYFKIYKRSHSVLERKNVRVVEQSIHNLLTFHGEDISISGDYNGNTEIFKYKDWMDNLI